MIVHQDQSDQILITSSSDLPHQVHVHIDSLNYYFIIGVKILLVNISQQKENVLNFSVVNEYDHADVIICDGYGHIPSKCSMPATISQKEHNKPHIILGMGKKRLGSICPYLYNESVNCQTRNSVERRVSAMIENLIQQRKLPGSNHLPCDQCNKRMFNYNQKTLISLTANGYLSELTENVGLSIAKKNSKHRNIIKNKLNIHSTPGFFSFCKWYAGYN